MLNVQLFQTIAMSGVTGVVLGSGSVFAFLKKKGVDVPNVIKTVEQTAESLEPAISFAKTIVPLNPVVNAADIIEKWTVKAVKNADQLYYSNQLGANQDRKSVAKNTVYAVLKEFGITPNKNQEKLIDDAIEAAVLDLGLNKTEEEKQAEKQALQAKLDQVTAERDAFKQTINTITNVATAVNTTQSAQSSDTSTTNTATPSATIANASQPVQTT